jgi:hypothetical protein
MAIIVPAIATAHMVATLIRNASARGRLVVLRLAAVVAEARIHQARLEAEMYRNRYRLRTKNDDDLPIIR